MKCRGIMMSEKENKTASRKKITFKLDLPDAREVVLMGDFNQWGSKKHRMKRNNNGVWEMKVILGPGAHEYKFLVDGQWKNDPANPLSCANCFGSKNNFVFI